MAENNLFDIGKRVGAARQTRKITRTMELIASSRLQRGKVLLAGHQPWLTHMREAARCLPNTYFEPLPGAPGTGQKAYIVFGGTKGLSGAYNVNLLQYAKPIVSGHMVIAVGSATQAFFPDAHSFLGDEIPSPDYGATIVRAGKALYENREAHGVYMIYRRGTAHVTEPLFPLKRPGEPNELALVEPSPRALFPVLGEAYAEAIVYEAHLQAFIAEQIARVSAMDNATRNADEIIDDLQATYNRIRQFSITQEILTVSNAAKGDRSSL